MASGSGQLKALMDGAIIEVLVNSGDRVEQGQTLAVMEAMKMEHQLTAGISGVVDLSGLRGRPRLQQRLHMPRNP